VPRETIRAALLREVGGPTRVESVEIDAPREHEVLIRISAVGVCHSDLHFYEGTYRCPLPAVLGHEAAGIVEAVGDQVTHVSPGDRVVTCLSSFCGECLECMRGRLSLCLARMVLRTRPEGAGPALLAGDETVFQMSGLAAFAEKMLVHERATVKIADGIPMDRAALIGCAVVTGLGAVFHTAAVRPGASVAVIGCGGVGLNLIQGARIAGALEVIAVDRVPEKLDLATEMGATRTILAGDEDVAARIQDATGGGVEYAFEAIGMPQTAALAMACLAPGGTATIVGLLAPDASVEVPSVDLLVEKRLQGCAMGSNRFRIDIPAYISMYEDGRLKLDQLVSRTIALDELPDAFERLAAGEVVRTLVVNETG
jgi:S-(hydroxymethyl)glutathione dehydrogenase/alcohol dehydrogenase